MKHEHSKLPWTVEENIAGKMTIIMSGDEQVAACYEYARDSYEMDMANAAFIVEAVNGHEKLAGIVREIPPILSWGISVCQWYREFVAAVEKAGLLRPGEVKSLSAEEKIIRTLFDKERDALGKEVDDGRE